MLEIKITGVLGETPELKQILRANSELSIKLNNSLGDYDFGDLLDQFIIFIISVDDDESVNNQFANSHNKLSKYKNPFTLETVRLLSVSVKIPPREFKNTTPNNIHSIIYKSILDCLKERPKRLPKGFDFNSFSRCISNEISSYI